MRFTDDRYWLSAVEDHVIEIIIIIINYCRPTEEFGHFYSLQGEMKGINSARLLISFNNWQHFSYQDDR